MAPQPPTAAVAAAPWSHSPSFATKLWILVSVPLVIWDIMYALGMPHTLPGGKWHEPLFVPYARYGQIDHVYGAKAWETGGGFVRAQSVLNVVECVAYLGYVGAWACSRCCSSSSSSAKGGIKAGGRSPGVPPAAVLLGFAGAVTTLTKTALYRK